MELSRRDALAALSSAGIVVGGGAAVLARDAISFEEDTDGPSAVSVIETLDAVARIVYPSALDGVGEFVESYSATRIDERPAYAAGVRESVASLDDYTRVHADADRFVALPREKQEIQLQRMGVESAEPAPDGTTAERIRYYLVNELLFALYSSPTGGRLVGIENPQGHPGGTDSYQRGPPE
jgi:hypothetical protein